MITYMLVTIDKYEQVVYSAKTFRELAEGMGMNKSTLAKAYYNGSVVDKRYRVLKIEEGDEDEEE